MSDSRTIALHSQASATNGTYPEIPGVRIEREIARGGMGIVYFGWQPLLQRSVAVKVLISPQSQASADTKERLSDKVRFENEALTLAQLIHPNIVRLHDCGQCPQGAYLVMEFVPGGSLAQRLHRGPLSVQQTLSMMIAIAHAVEAAHQLGVIHRDLKPGNILLDEHDQPKVADFGIAYRQNQLQLTRTGEIVGTLSYMAPERLSAGQAVTVASDVYALGVILYEMLTGSNPFPGDDPLMMLAMLQSNTVPPLTSRNKAIPRDLELICLKALEKEPHLRYRSAADFADDLARFQRDEPITARAVSSPEKVWRWSRKNPLVSGLIVACLGVLLMGFATTLFLWQQAEFQRTEVESQRDRAERAEKENFLRVQQEQTEKLKAQQMRDEAQTQLYLSEMMRVQGAWNNNRFAVAKQLLQRYHPAQGRDPSELKDRRGLEWYFWQQQLAAQNAELLGHTHSVTALRYSPDDRWLISGDNDGSVKCWDVQKKQQKWSVPSPNADRSFVSLIQFCQKADGQPLFAMSASGRSWQIDDAGQRKLVEPTGPQFIHSAISQDATKQLERTPGKLRLRDLPSRKVLWELSGTFQAVFSHDPGTSLAAVGQGSDILLLSPEGKVEKQIRTGQKKPFIFLRLDRAQKYVLATTYDRSVQLWQIESGRLLRQWTALSGSVRWIEFSPKGDQIAALLNGAVVFWDVASGQQVHSIKGHCGSIATAAFRGDGQELATGGYEGGIRIWSLTDPRFPQNLPELTSPLGTAFTPDGDLLTSVSPTQGKIYDTTTGKEKARFALPKGSKQVCFCEQSQEWVVLTREWNLSFYEKSTGQLTREYRPASPISRIADGGNGEILCGSFRQLSRLKLATLEEEAIPGDYGQFLNLATWRGSLTATAEVRVHRQRQDDVIPEHIDVFLRSTNAEPRLLRSCKMGTLILAMTISVDGRLVAFSESRVADPDSPSQVFLFDTQDRTVQRTFGPFLGRVTQVQFSKDGQRLFAGTERGAWALWDVSSGQELLSLQYPEFTHTQWAWSQDGSRMACFGADKARLWTVSPPHPSARK
jgi:WD40 repeat protein